MVKGLDAEDAAATEAWFARELVHRRDDVGAGAVMQRLQDLCLDAADDDDAVPAELIDGDRGDRVFAEDDVRAQVGQAHDEIAEVVALLLEDGLEAHELALKAVILEREGEEHDAGRGDEAAHRLVHHVFGEDNAVDVLAVLRPAAGHLFDPDERPDVHRVAAAYIGRRVACNSGKDREEVLLPLLLPRHARCMQALTEEPLNVREGSGREVEPLDGNGIGMGQAEGIKEGIGARPKRLVAMREQAKEARGLGTAAAHVQRTGD
jgi:hypothetical protein